AEPPRRAGILAGCVMQVLFRRTNENTARLLAAAGYQVMTPAGQVCCGALHAHNGDLAAARKAARTNLRAFESADLDVIIVNAAGCGSLLKEYDRLLGDDERCAANARAFATKVRDLTE